MSGLDISLEGQDALLIEKIEAYMAWAQEEPRIAGIVPWHWGKRVKFPPYGSPGEAQFGLGASSFPGLVARLLEMGWKNSSQLVLECAHPA